MDSSKPFMLNGSIDSFCEINEIKWIDFDIMISLNYECRTSWISNVNSNNPFMI